MWGLVSLMTWALRCVLLLGVLGCVWRGATSACPGCAVQDVWIEGTGHTRLHARLYVPAAARPNSPAVVVIHGYLANSGFLEVPWAADLSGLSIISLFIDRAGHGRSDGRWWPPDDRAAPPLSELYPDIRAALASLRTRAPLVDPSRIGLVGHSDGGTGAMMVASADWDVAATVSLSASVAPWEYVNHVVPRNLLLLYGRDDRFILADTDVLLAKNATRGYLGGEGEVGSMGDGSARRLTRVDGRGHLDVIHSETARRIALAWLAATFGVEGDVRLSRLRWIWVVSGTLLLVLLMLLWNGLPPPGQWHEGLSVRTAKLIVIAALWLAGLGLASWTAPKLRGIPAQEGSVVVGVLGAESLLMGAAAVPVSLWRWRRGTRGAGSRWLTDAGRGAALGVFMQLALEAVLHPVYTTALNSQRAVLFLGCLPLALAAFAATCAAATWVGRGGGQIIRAIPVEAVLACLTAVLAPYWFTRMSAFPVAVLALVLLFVAAYRAGGGSAAGAATLGAVMYARGASVVCALY